MDSRFVLRLLLMAGVSVICSLHVTAVPERSVTGISTSPSSSIKERMNVSDHLDQCTQSDIWILGTSCQSYEFSCKMGCTEGRFMTQDFPCYCDHMCLLYGDCCHDFSEICGYMVSIFNQRLHYMQGVDIMCVDDGFAVVGSCPLQHYPAERMDVDFEEEKFLNSLDVIVTDAYTGVHFVNYTIFSCNRVMISKPMFWNKRYKPEEFPNSQSIHQPPKDIRARNCSSYNMICGRTVSERCRIISGYNINAVCIHATRKMSELNVVGEKSNTNAKKIGHRANDEKIGSCRAIVTSGNKAEHIKFGIIVSFQGSFIFSLTDPNTQMAWDKVECERSIGEKCYVTKCKNIYYKMDQYCLRLKSLTVNYIYTEKMSNIRTKCLNFTQNAIKSLNHTLHYDLTNVSTEESKNGSYMVTVEYSVVRSVSDDQNSYFPFFAHVLDKNKLSTMFSTVQEMMNLREVSLCAAMEDGKQMTQFVINTDNGKEDKEDIVGELVPMGYDKDVKDGIVRTYCDRLVYPLADNKLIRATSSTEDPHRFTQETGNSSKLSVRNNSTRCNNVLLAYITLFVVAYYFFIF